ncbi:Uncharacterized protein DAT39_012289 [Clarias magur]|uniref:Uncharacterized protein n=1 Tax=Clarias magur TaxID=1594786 RepID=A0A8J4ULP6_CLAMG|nr:Uncharacterized protein DAT39_012289 [Clarias magur]
MCSVLRCVLLRAHSGLFENSPPRFVSHKPRNWNAFHADHPRLFPPWARPSRDHSQASDKPSVLQRNNRHKQPLPLPPPSPFYHRKAPTIVQKRHRISVDSSSLEVRARPS